MPRDLRRLHRRFGLVLGSAILFFSTLMSTSWATDRYGEARASASFSLTLTARSTGIESAGGRFRLKGGTRSEVERDLIFADGFESGDTSAWGQGTELPAGAVVFINGDSCPTGWSQLADQARFLVGLPAGGQAAGTVNAGFLDLYPTYHRHSIAEAIETGGLNEGHYHRWSDLQANGAWQTFADDGSTVTMIDWGDGIDNSGEGYYPFTAYLDSHYETSVSGHHNHTIDYDVLTFSERDALPYVQLRVCVKDSRATR